MTEVFVDTQGWAALRVRSDRHHALAHRTWTSLCNGGASFVTSQAVLSETYTLLAHRVGREYAVRFGESLRAAKHTEVVYVNPDLDAAAWELFVRYEDKLFSYVDCISFAIMEQRGIRQALTYDHHFEQAGFEALLRPA